MANLAASALGTVYAPPGGNRPFKLGLPKRQSMTSLHGCTALALSLLVIVVGANCSSSDAAGLSGVRCVGPICEGSSGGKTGQMANVVISTDASGSDSRPAQNPLCGSGCVPDQTERCDSDGGVLDAGDDSGDSSSAPVSEVRGCQVDLGSPVVARCEAAGAGTAASPCNSAADCAPGYACVGEQTGQCSKYCCFGSTACGVGTFCTTRPLFDRNPEAGAEAQLVPVCQIAQNCRLDEPLDCSGTNQACVCKGGTVCTLVASGTTSCMDAGTGTTGQPCPCAPFYVCSQATQTCQALCSTKASTLVCDGGICQASSWLPSDFGICTLGPEVDAG